MDMDLTYTVSDEDKIKIRNLCDHTICYSTNDGMHRRELSPNQEIVVTAAELRQLNSDRGGHYLLERFIEVENQELAKEFGIDVEETPEYTWRASDVDDVLLNQSIERLEDALDFAPEGIVNLIVTRAVELDIPDNRKREAIQKRTNRNISNMIENNKKLHEIEYSAPRPSARKRRVPVK